MSKTGLIGSVLRAFNGNAQTQHETHKDEKKRVWKAAAFHLERNGPGIGLSLFRGTEYLATYTDCMECLRDLAFQWDCKELARITSPFLQKSPHFRYRGVCSEMYWPTETIFRYVCYGNKLSDIFERFSVHERRAIENERYFEYGVQGTGIHMFDERTRQYEFWVGGNEIRSATDIMQEIQAECKTIPTNLPDAVVSSIRTAGWDVFISHKSEAFADSKRIYDIVKSWGKSVFLSEESLPAIGNADYCETISKCLEQSKHLIVLADSRENLLSGWVKYEWQSFLNEKLSGRKAGNLIVILSPPMRPEDLPFQLRQFQAISIDELDAIQHYLI